MIHLLYTVAYLTHFLYMKYYILGLRELLRKRSQWEEQVPGSCDLPLLYSVCSGRSQQSFILGQHFGELSLPSSLLYHEDHEVVRREHQQGSSVSLGEGSPPDSLTGSQ